VPLTGTLRERGRARASVASAARALSLLALVACAWVAGRTGRAFAQARPPEESAYAAAPASEPEPAAPPVPPVGAASEEALRRLIKILFPDDLRLALHGYFRAPLRLALASRGMGQRPGEASYNLRTPWLVDDDYFRSGFSYTRLAESDWSELYFSVGNQHLTGEVALMGSLFSDWARPLIDRQWGIAQAFLRFHWERSLARWRLGVAVKGGAFWDRFGWLPAYDTYIFGRTHQLGAQGRLEAAGEHVTLWLLYGLGAHLEAIDANQGLTLLNYVHAGVRLRRILSAGFYFLDSTAHDKRQLKELTDASMSVVGVDARLTDERFGQLYLAFSKVSASQATYLSPAIEVMHAFGGRGLTENYLGTEKSENGTGALWNVALDYRLSVRQILSRWPQRQAALRGGDVQLGVFGLLAHVNSKQIDDDPAINRDGRTNFKWGVEGSWWALSWLAVSLRYDRVILDTKDDANAFRVISPRLSLRTHWLADGELFFQYSRYSYGARAQLRPGQVALETQPDTDVFKIQAQLTF
jgi:hypothetical protein